MCVCETRVEMGEEDSEGKLSDLYEVDEEEDEEGGDSVAVEEVRRDTWSRKGAAAEQRVTGRESCREEVVSELWLREGKEEKKGEELKLSKEASSKAGYVKISKEQRTEGEDGETSKSGGESQEGGNAQSQGMKIQELRKMKEKVDGEGGENVVLETPGTNVEEEMDTCEEKNIGLQRKRKKKGMEQYSGIKCKPHH
ncbi:neurofilament medium polypeptide-like [Sinocyclocheilus grahami]|uniref:neurofilament medium polypeptide-like n=1 Tax=Sinocyclocheilus grahami TaxID=75366 RepID=UPI0007ACDCE4|nr:PREDICTED: neurofilament medium polypeptide-like [Sinocyclocheilus grahami]